MNQLHPGWLGRGIIVMCVASAMVGCTTYQQQNKIAQPWHQSNLPVALKEAEAAVKSNGDGKDAIIWRLEQSTVLRAAGKTAESTEAFNLTEDRIDKYQQEAKTKLANETGAMFVNQAALPYRGRFYDGIMVNTYKALNHLQLKDCEKARVELNRAAERQKDAVEENRKRIEKAQDALQKQKADDQKIEDKKADDQKIEDKKTQDKIQKAQENEKFKTQMSASFGDLDQMKVYGDYVNPFTVYLDGLVCMANPGSGADLERARKAFQEVNGYVDNKFVKADLEAIEGVLQQSKAIPPTTYVIFETGSAPIRDQIRIDIPIMVISLSYVGAAFPKLKLQEDWLPGLRVTANGTNETTALVCSMDSVVGRNFKNELPTIITKTIAATIIKAAATTAANEAARQADSTAGIVMKSVTAAYQASVNIADLRTWTTLPKEFQVCRVPTPPDRKIELASVNGGPSTTVTVDEGTYNIVYVRSISASGPLLISQMKLK